ncbi:unnamed protein product, partial [Phaeothamnion confervicola]
VAPDIHGREDVAGLFPAHPAMASFRLMFDWACDFDADTAAQARAPQHGVSPHPTSQV